MSYDISVSVAAWPSDVVPRWVAELAQMGIKVAFPPDYDPQTAAGWCPITVAVTDASAPIPLARTLAKKKTFESGFELHIAEDRALFSAKTTEGNATAIWCAAALGAVVGGTVEDPQHSLNATGTTGAAILATLAESSAFVSGISGPEPKTKRKAAAGVPKPAKSTVVADLSKPVHTYSASDKFEVGERVEHPSFGEGVVEVSAPGKITAFFSGARRVLVQSKDGGTSVGTTTDGLDRPRPIDHTARSGNQKV